MHLYWVKTLRVASIVLLIVALVTGFYSGHSLTRPLIIVGLAISCYVTARLFDETVRDV